MEPVANVLPSATNTSVGGNNSKKTGGAEGATNGNNSNVSSTTESPTAKATPSPSLPTAGSNTNSSSNNPIFVITNSSTISTSSSNNIEMPSNSHFSESSTTAGGGHSAEDDEGGGSSSVATESPSTHRPSNPRQSTLTRSHAITLDEDSDTAGSDTPGLQLQPQEEHELIHFIIDTCNKSPKDKNFVLRIEADLTQFVKDETRHQLPFPQMTSYQRMLVHRIATLFDLDHNVDNSSGGNFVVVSKDLNGRGHGGRIPPIRFKEVVPPVQPSHPSVDPNVPLEIPPPVDPLSAPSKKILKREKPSLTADKKGVLGGQKTKSLEERTQDYHKARRRIFEDESASMSLDATSKKLNWSSTDSSEDSYIRSQVTLQQMDKMYLKPPFPTTSGGKLIKVESFESASKKPPQSRGAMMGKSHSFGGYEDSQSHVPPVRTTKHFSGGASNNASSSMISCSSSSSLRSSSFSKQDSSSSTTSGSGQSPSGGTSSSTSGYKSSSSSGYYPGTGAILPNGLMGACPGMQQEMVKPTHTTPQIVFAPATQHQPEDTSMGSSQQVVFCCWAMTDVNNVPPGALILDPTTGHAVKNNDGTQYYYDPSNPPKFIAPPQPPSTPSQEQQYVSQTIYPQQVIGPSVTYAPPQPPTASSAPPTFMTTAVPSSQLYYPTSGPSSDVQELSGYFSQLNTSTTPRQTIPSVIYVPVDASGTPITSYQEPQVQAQPQQFYEEQPIPVQFQQAQAAPGGGYVLQQVVDASSGGVYYYGGLPTPTSQATAPVTQGQNGQPRYKNWVVPHQQQVTATTAAYIHGASSQLSQAQPQSSTGPTSGAIMIHSNAQSQVVPGAPTMQPAGLMPVPAVLPPALPQTQIGSGQQPLSSSLIPSVPCYHPSGQSSHPLHASSTPTLMQTLVPCVQSPVFPPPQQSFGQSQTHQASSHRSHHHSPRAQHQHQNPPRFLAVATSNTITQQQQQQQHHQQLLFAAAAAMAMSNNYTFAGTTGTRFVKNSGTGMRTNVHAPVTGVVRRSRNYSSKQQNTSK